MAWLSLSIGYAWKFVPAVPLLLKNIGLNSVLCMGSETWPLFCDKEMNLAFYWCLAVCSTLSYQPGVVIYSRCPFQMPVCFGSAFKTLVPQNQYCWTTVLPAVPSFWGLKLIFLLLTCIGYECPPWPIAWVDAIILSTEVVKEVPFKALEMAALRHEQVLDWGSSPMMLLSFYPVLYRLKIVFFFLFIISYYASIRFTHNCFMWMGNKNSRSISNLSSWDPKMSQNICVCSYHPWLVNSTRHSNIIDNKKADFFKTDLIQYHIFFLH